MKINSIPHYLTNYHVLNIFQGLSIFLSKMYNVLYQGKPRQLPSLNCLRIALI